MKQVKSIPDKIVAGIGLLFVPFLASIFKAPDNIPFDGYVFLAAMSLLCFVSLITSKNIWMLTRCHEKFRKHYMRVHGVAILSSIFLPPPFSFYLVSPFCVYTGWYSVECEREIINKYETNDG